MARRAESLTQTVIDYVCAHGPVSSMDVFAAVDEISDRQHLAVILSQACKDGRLQKYDAPAGSKSRLLFLKPGALVPTSKPVSVLHQATPPKPAPATKSAVEKKDAAESQVTYGFTKAVLHFIKESSEPVSAKAVLEAVPQLRSALKCSKILNRLLDHGDVISVPAPAGTGRGVRFLYTTPRHRSISSGLKGELAKKEHVVSVGVPLMQHAACSTKIIPAVEDVAPATQAQHSTGFGYQQCIDGVVFWRGSQAFSLSNRELAEFIAAWLGA